jgi:hypothetical protein
MKKVLLALLSIGIAFTAIQPAQAQEQKVIAIIDTAIDSSKFNNIVHEVCFTTALKDNSGTCPNGQTFQEGPGAASVSNWKLRGIDHGHNVAKAATNANPNVKIVFIRYNDQLATRGHGDMNSMAKALDWISNNATRLNIGGVSISQASGNYIPSTCSKHTAFGLTKNSVDSLSSQNVDVFAATGNGGRTDTVGFPACVGGVIGVGAVRPSLTLLASYTNSGPGLDMVARGDTVIQSYLGRNITVTGTSIATPIAAVLSVSRGINGQTQSFISSLTKVLGYPYIG